MQVAGYHDVNEIGRGGFATVYAARVDETGERVALKVFHTSGSDRRRIERELAALEKLKGIPGVVPVLGVTEAEDGSPVMVMPLLPDTMSSRMAAGGVPPEVAIGWLEDIGTAVDRATLAGVHHRDIKPNNVLIDDEGHALLADFGISAFAEMDSGTTTASAFSPPYAAPERLAGGTGIDLTASDVYSLAATTWAAIVGDAPFGTTTTGGVSGLISRVMANELDLPTSMTPALYDVLRTGMALDPADRYPTASALVGAARHALEFPDDVTVVRLPTSIVPVATGSAVVSSAIDSTTDGSVGESGQGSRPDSDTGDGTGSDGLVGSAAASNGRKVALIGAMCLLLVVLVAGAVVAVGGGSDDVRTVEKASSSQADHKVTNPTVTVESATTESTQDPGTSLPADEILDPLTVTNPNIDAGGGPPVVDGPGTVTAPTAAPAPRSGPAPTYAPTAAPPTPPPATAPPATVPPATTPPPTFTYTVFSLYRSPGECPHDPGMIPLKTGPDLTSTTFGCIGVGTTWTFTCWVPGTKAYAVFRPPLGYSDMWLRLQDRSKGDLYLNTIIIDQFVDKSVVPLC